MKGSPSPSTTLDEKGWGDLFTRSLPRSCRGTLLLLIDECAARDRPTPSGSQMVPQQVDRTIQRLPTHGARPRDAELRDLLNVMSVAESDDYPHYHLWLLVLYVTLVLSLLSVLGMWWSKTRRIRRSLHDPGPIFHDQVADYRDARSQFAWQSRSHSRAPD